MEHASLCCISMNVRMQFIVATQSIDRRAIPRCAISRRLVELFIFLSNRVRSSIKQEISDTNQIDRSMCWSNENVTNEVTWSRTYTSRIDKITRRKTWLTETDNRPRSIEFFVRLINFYFVDFNNNIGYKIVGWNKRCFFFVCKV